MQTLSPAFFIPILVVFVAGVGFAIQAPLNAALGKGIGGGVAAATISFGVGFAALLVLTFVLGEGRALTRAMSVSPMYWAGGLLGTVVVWSMLWSVPTIGILTAFAALLLGQLSAALVLDAIGAFAAPVHAITPTRVLALLMVAGGLILSRF
ncbi:MAG: DMT family transporter [Jannaschia helgolandensis]|jgi:bacterial/archaeal transporter family-2 protein|uniref:Transporter family-2 protein n=1 Tax=Jannaschia helgolandensis TaxID=188906 RepID=A0A1H7FXJ9_9RHOB|nr:DMT family transporter [Jannaschia helgolandensis]SEK30669.1 transporter family-2 protein [Jannaschia helgolandensis]|tara:strand:- start:1630 stop:2085 length:456 start_codon:yes stop_codon:yes gene_type:complete